MKKLLPIVLSTIFIVIGIAFLIFVIRMILFPPTAMGMMMGRRMMMHHMFFWFGQLFWISLIGAGVAIFIWMILSKRKS